MWNEDFSNIALNSIFWLLDNRGGKRLVSKVKVSSGEKFVFVGSIIVGKKGDVDFDDMDSPYDLDALETGGVRLKPVAWKPLEYP